MSNSDESESGRSSFPVKKVPELSPYGQTLLKQLRGSSSMLNAKSVARWGLDNPKSVLHAVPESFSQLVTNLPEEILDTPEAELESIAGGVTRQDRRVRILFWGAYEEAHTHSKKMDLESIASDAGLPSWESYEQRLYQKPALLSWLMKTPAAYQLQMKEAQEISLSRLIEILSLPIKELDSKGKERINTHVALLILSAAKMVDNRIFGTPTQKNVTISMDTGRVPDNARIDPAELDKKLKELEDAVNGRPAEIEVTSE